MLRIAAVCPVRVVMSSPVFGFHKCSLPSSVPLASRQPSMGQRARLRTGDRSSRVALSNPVVRSHNAMVRSRLALISVAPSGLMIALVTAAVCKARVVARLTVRSITPTPISTTPTATSTMPTVTSTMPPITSPTVPAPWLVPVKAHTTSITAMTDRMSLRLKRVFFIGENSLISAG